MAFNTMQLLNKSNWESPSIYRPEANAWISKCSSDLDYQSVFALVVRGHVEQSMINDISNDFKSKPRPFPIRINKK